MFTVYNSTDYQLRPRRRLKNTFTMTADIRAIFELLNMPSVYYKPSYIVVEAV